MYLRYLRYLRYLVACWVRLRVVYRWVTAGPLPCDPGTLPTNDTVSGATRVRARSIWGISGISGIAQGYSRLRE